MAREGLPKLIMIKIYETHHCLRAVQCGGHHELGSWVRQAQQARGLHEALCLPTLVVHSPGTLGNPLLPL